LALKALKQGKYSIEELKKLLETQLSYKNELIGQIASKPEILTLDTPEIIRDVKVINKSILQKIDRNPNEIYHLNSRQFEELVAELFEERGYNVKLTQQTRDGGKDLIIINKGMLGDFLIYGECKKWAPNRPVGVNVVSDLAGRMLANSATAGLVVTSSYFSPDAQIFTQKIKHRMSLVDFVELSKWITPQKNK
jgi:restriction system protein